MSEQCWHLNCDCPYGIDDIVDGVWITWDNGKYDIRPFGSELEALRFVADNANSSIVYNSGFVKFGECV